MKIFEKCIYEMRIFHNRYRQKIFKNNRKQSIMFNSLQFELFKYIVNNIFHLNDTIVVTIHYRLLKKNRLFIKCL